MIFLAILCLLASATPVSAQLIIHNNGNAEMGVNPFDPHNTNLNPMFLNWLDTVTVLRVFGRYGNQAAGGHLTFGDTYLYNTYNVLVGELGYTDCDKLWLHGKSGAYLTANSAAADTVMYYDPFAKGNYVGFNKDVHTSGVFVQSDERFKENVESQYVFATDVTAGRAVDSGRTAGGVTVKEGAEYEIEASGEVTLAGGFQVELGARFSVQRTSYK